MAESGVAVNPDIRVKDLLKFAHDPKRLEKICKGKDIIRILIVGKTRVGKSTLIYLGRFLRFAWGLQPVELLLKWIHSTRSSKM